RRLPGADGLELSLALLVRQRLQLRLRSLVHARARRRACLQLRHHRPADTQREGLSVFYRDDSGRIFHTYSAYARGIDIVNTAYNYLDLVPKGRDEDGRGPFWVRRHDEYGRD